MSNWPPDWLNEYPPGVRDALDAGLTDRLAAPIVLMRLFLVLGNAARISSLLSRAEADRQRAGDGQGARRIAAVRDLVSRDPSALDRMRDVLAILHGDTKPAEGEQTSATAAAFDAAADVSPAASVALYSLGDPTVLESATREVVSFLRSREIISREARILEIGCGIGRFAEALASEVGTFVGIDVSAKMIRLAQRRCADLRNVILSVTAGNDLRNHPDKSFDLVLAVDSFPYIAAVGEPLAELHIKESARVLARAGSLAIFNFSYEEGFAASRELLQRWSPRSGLELVAAEPNPLRSWDGSFFHLRKQSFIAQIGLVEPVGASKNVPVPRDSG